MTDKGARLSEVPILPIVRPCKLWDSICFTKIKCQITATFYCEENFSVSVLFEAEEAPHHSLFQKSLQMPTSLKQLIKLHKPS